MDAAESRYAMTADEYAEAFRFLAELQEIVPGAAIVEIRAADNDKAENSQR